MEVRSYTKELLEMVGGLEGIPRDVDLGTMERTFTDDEGRKTRWKVLFVYGNELQVVEAEMEPGAEFPCHLHESIDGGEQCSETFMVKEGHLSLILSDFDDPIIREIYPGDCYIVIPGESHSCKAGEDGVRFFSALFPASKGI